MQASFDFAFKRDSFEQTMNGLAYQAFKNSQDYTLSGTYDSHGSVEDQQANNSTVILPDTMKTVPLIATTREVRPSVAPAKAPLHLPDGWTLEINEPIYYRSSGFCTGGTMDLRIGRRSFTYRAAPPFCELSLEQS
jgi:hypothetical protein